MNADRKPAGSPTKVLLESVRHAFREWRQEVRAGRRARRPLRRRAAAAAAVTLAAGMASPAVAAASPPAGTEPAGSRPQTGGPLVPVPPPAPAPIQVPTPLQNDETGWVNLLDRYQQHLRDQNAAQQPDAPELPHGFTGKAKLDLNPAPVAALEVARQPVPEPSDETGDEPDDGQDDQTEGTTGAIDTGRLPSNDNTPPAAVDDPNGDDDGEPDSDVASVPDAEDTESRPPAREATTLVEPAAVAMEPATAPPEPGDDSFAPMAAAAGPTPVAARTGKAPAAQTPPVPTRNPVRGVDDLPDTPIPEFGAPGRFGEEPSREVTLQQLQIADNLTQFAPNDKNPVTAESSGTASAKGKLGKVGDRQAQSAKAVRNAENNTVELEATSRQGTEYDALIARYSEQQFDRTNFKLSTESTQRLPADGPPNFRTMLPGDIITRTPQLPDATVTELGAGRRFGKLAEAQIVGQREGPALQYSVAALGEGRYSLTFGEASSRRSRSALSIGKDAARIGAQPDLSVSRFDGAQVHYDARTPEGRAGLRTAIEGLEQGVKPTLEPGSYFNSVAIDKSEDVTYASGKLSGKVVPTTPEVESKIGIDRNGITTTTTTLMKSVDGTAKNAEPIGYSVVESTRLGTGNPLGVDPSFSIGGVTFLGDMVPTDVTIRSTFDSGLNTNEVTFTANGQKFTLSQSDLVQRAREMSETDPDTVNANPVLSDLAAGVGVRAALTNPPNTFLGITHKDINDALQTLVTPPVPDHNPFAPPPMPERRADDLSFDPEQQQAAFVDPDGFLATASLDTGFDTDADTQMASARSLSQNNPDFDGPTSFTPSTSESSIDSDSFTGGFDGEGSDASDSSFSGSDSSDSLSSFDSSDGFSSSDSLSSSDSSSSFSSSDSSSDSDSTTSFSSSDSFSGSDSSSSFGGSDSSSSFSSSSSSFGGSDSSSSSSDSGGDGGF